MGISLYGCPSNLDRMGKISNEAWEIIDKYKKNYDDIFEIFVEDLEQMISELKQINEEEIARSLEQMISMSINCDYFLLALY